MLPSTECVQDGQPERFDLRRSQRLRVACRPSCKSRANSDIGLQTLCLSALQFTSISCCPVPTISAARTLIVQDGLDTNPYAPTLPSHNMNNPTPPFRRRKFPRAVVARGVYQATGKPAALTATVRYEKASYRWAANNGLRFALPLACPVTTAERFGGIMLKLFLAVLGATMALSVQSAYAAKGPEVIVAHRGVGPSVQVKYGIPENSIPAWGWAIDHAKRDFIVDMDAQITSDAQMVIMHDSTIDRTTNRTGRVHDRTLAYIKAAYLELPVDRDGNGNDDNTTYHPPSLNQAVTFLQKRLDPWRINVYASRTAAARCRSPKD